MLRLNHNRKTVASNHATSQRMNVLCVKPGLLTSTKLCNGYGKRHR